MKVDILKRLVDFEWMLKKVCWNIAYVLFKPEGTR